MRVTSYHTPEGAALIARLIAVAPISADSEVGISKADAHCDELRLITVVQITIAYVDTMMPAGPRHELLNEAFWFACQVRF